MTRVVHVVSAPTGGDESVLACAAATREPGFEHSVVFVGHRDEAVRAGRSALAIDSLVADTSVSKPWMAPRRLRSALIGLMPRANTPTIINAWCVHSSRAARAAVTAGVSHVAVLSRLPRPGERPPFFPTDVTLAAFDRSLGTAWTDRDLAYSQSATDRVRILDTPRLNVSTSADHRTSIRHALGIEDETPCVVLLASDPNRADVLSFAFRLGLMHTTGRSGVGVAPRGVPHARRAARFVRLNGRRWGLVLASQPLPELLAAADAVWADSGPASSPAPAFGPVVLRCAAEMGVPVVGQDSPMFREHVGPAAAQLAVEQTSASSGVALLLRLIEDASYRDTLSGLLRAHAQRTPSAHTLANLWREVANEPAAAESARPPNRVELGARA